MFFERLQILCSKNGTDVSNVLRTLGLSTSKGTAWKGGAIPKGDILLKLANYFHVSTDYLLGNTDDPRPAGQEKAPAPESRREIDEKDIRAAFFGGADDLSEEEIDAMWNDAKDYIQYKLEQRRRKKDGELG